MKVILADELPDERGERQACPHGVDDGACKQCYCEALVPECNGSHDYSTIEAGIETECTVCTGGAPTLGDVKYTHGNAAIAAIEYALRADEGLVFLECWLHGQFDIIRNEWSDAPDAIIPDSASTPTLGEQPQAAETKGLTNWRERCAVIVDIYDDAKNNAPEDRCYADGAFGQEIDELRALLAEGDAE